MLPGLDGIGVCRAIRAEPTNAATPILMITARDGEADTVLGLESGADDYLAKPFGVRELMARITAITRRRRNPAAPGGNGVVSAGGLTLDPQRRRLVVRGAEVELTKQEFDLLLPAGRAPGDRLQPDGAAAAGVARGHLRDRTHRGRGDQPPAPQGRARPGRPRAAPHRLGRRLQVRRRPRLSRAAGVAVRQPDRERGAPRPALDVDRAAMAFDDRLDDRQPEPAAAVAAGAGPVRLVEPIEDVRQVRGGMPSPVSSTVTQ